MVVVDQVPVTILTGFLGAGKTTLLNHLLTNQKGLKFAVIENEFGDVGVDDELIKNRKFAATEEVVEMMNGCICCTVRQDLVKVLERLLVAEKRKFDAIVIETTGLADPAPIVQTFFVHDIIKKLCRLDAVVTVVDAGHIEEQLARERPAGVENEAEEQIIFADKILLNKIDLIGDDAEHRARLHAAIKKLNPTVQIVETQQSEIDPEQVLGLNAFSLDRVLELDPELLKSDGTDHLHDSSVSSFCVVSPEPMSVALLERWISKILQTLGKSLFRYKGVINVQGMDERFVFQGVHMLFQGSFTTPWRADETRQSKFVFIGKNLPLDELRDFASCKALPLRFPVGTKVLASVGKMTPGKIIKQWDEGNAYRIRLNDGTEVWAPIDEDSYVRRR